MEMMDAIITYLLLLLYVQMKTGKCFQLHIYVCILLHMPYPWQNMEWIIYQQGYIDIDKRVLQGLL